MKRYHGAVSSSRASLAKHRAQCVAVDVCLVECHRCFGADFISEMDLMDSPD